MTDYSDIMYAMGAMVIFSILIINTNSSIFRNEVLLIENELEHTAIALAQGIVEEARSKRFDQETLGDEEALNIPIPLLSRHFDPEMVPGSFTAPSNLGPEIGEVYPDFNDFDDYNGLELQLTTDHGEYAITAEVYYVYWNNPDVPASVQTEHKRMNVFVTSNYFNHTVTISYIKSF